MQAEAATSTAHPEIRSSAPKAMSRRSDCCWRGVNRLSLNASPHRRTALMGELDRYTQHLMLASLQKGWLPSAQEILVSGQIELNGTAISSSP